MANKEANIDLLFRNGLKDMEVLPPPEAWNNILPVIRRKQRPVLLLRSAAVAAALLSITFLAYKWGRELSFKSDNPFSAYENSLQPAANPLQRIVARRLPVVVNKLTEPAGETVLAERNKAQTTRSETKRDVMIETREEQGISAVYDNIGIPLFAYIPDVLPARAPSGTTGKVVFPVEAEINKSPEMTFEMQSDKRGRWSVFAGGSPDYYMRQGLRNSGPADQIYKSEQSRVSYSGGLGFAYKINRKFSIQSGIYYASVGNEIAGINAFTGFREFNQVKSDRAFEVMTSGGKIFTDNPDVFLRDISGDRVLTRFNNDVFDPVKSNLSYLSNSLYQSFSYVEMPFMLRYKLIDKNIGFNLIGGVAYNFLISNNVHTMVDGNKYNIGKTEDLNPIMVSSSMGMGIEYNISSKFSLNLEPTFRYYLNPFSDTPGANYHPYSFGVFSGLSFKF